MKSVFERNKVIVLIAAVVISVVAMMSYFRHAKMERIAADFKAASAAQALSEKISIPQSAPQSLENSNQSEEYRKFVADQMVLRKKYEAEIRQQERVLVTIRSEIQRSRERITAQIKQQRQKVFKPLHIQAQLKQIETVQNVTESQRSNLYVDLRNEITISRTPAAVKKQILFEIDQKIANIKVPEFAGFDFRERPDGGFEAIPKTK